MTDFVVVIPARYASTRLPAKALLDIAGKPMVVHVADRAQRSGAREVWVATDDERILQAVQAHGHQAAMTDADHASGTDRIAEVAAKRGWTDASIVVNVQGDEPRIAPELIREVAQVLESDSDAAMSTACHALHRDEDLFDPNVVKVVLDAQTACAVLQPRDDSLGTRCVRAQPQRASHPGCPSTATSASTGIAASS